MLKPDWQVTEPFSAVIFDCDGTLSSIEGIDYLAELRGVYPEVAKLTQQAMAQSGLTPELYEQRLSLVKPTQADVIQLGEEYCRTLIPNLMDIITTLQKEHKAVYIISAGLREAVSKLGSYLSIPTDHIQAVDIFFDDELNYQYFDLQSPLIHNQGKQDFVKEIQKKHSRILYVGDGLNDLAVRPFVSRFVGFGGVFYREHIAAASDYYITDYSALLPLILTAKEVERLNAPLQLIYQQGLMQLNL